ncbi:MAG: DNA polymerase III subunit gamma/tau [Patescibacteria group bacterium]|nr:DNA polymerase III subunit gamma/tau [Patescibacteria group bacterium]
MNVLYRKYRPQKFADVVGQENIKNILTKGLEFGKVSQAYLFSGPRGVGKTTTARLVAKSLNCRQNKDNNFGEPCDHCDSCRAIAEGRYLDLIEIDAASNRGIDEIRDLREKIKLSPTEGKYKVYIIDEVHMLTNEAFNALLKTLEEPPVHAVFILCTTDPQKLPLTIISRCQRFDFKRATKEDLLKYLRYLSKAENLELEEETLTLISQKAEGSYRDAAKILDQLSLGNQKITATLVNEFFALSGSDSYSNLLDYLISKDVKEALVQINRIFENGQSLREFNKSFLEYLRRLLVIRADVGEELVKPQLTKEQYEKMGQQARSLTNQQVLRLINLFAKSEEGLKSAVIPQLPLELAIVEACSDGLNEAKTKKEAPKETEGKLIQSTRVEEPKKAEEEQDKAALVSPKKESSEEKSGEILNGSELTIEFIQEHWPSVLKSIKPHNHSLEALLKGCEPMSFDGKILMLKCAYRFHKERLESQKNNELLEKILSEIIGAKVRVKCLLGEKKATKNIDPQEVNNIVPVSDDDLVKSASDIFNGSLL